MISIRNIGRSQYAPRGPSRWEKAAVTSAASAFMGATYTILKLLTWYGEYQSSMPDTT